jgi:hypothetical protein
LATTNGVATHPRNLRQAGDPTATPLLGQASNHKAAPLLIEERHDSIKSFMLFSDLTARMLLAVLATTRTNSSTP